MKDHRETPDHKVLKDLQEIQEHKAMTVLKVL